ncbi:MAG: glycosyltransferase family 4 protein, partial [Krumholzibacteria bacterium]|nr:glycosyltransferase family 4 protein [Candidatus Krumholzibacteria bacterium]
AAAREGPGPAPGRAGRPRFLFVGTLEPRKNLEGILRAYTRFLAEAGRPASACPSLLFVGGRGWCDGSLRAAMVRLQAQGHLEVRGWCEPAELWRLYRTARALLFPSLHEGFGFPILEAMAAGLPVLTSDRGAMAEVAGEAALLADPRDTGRLAGALAQLAWDEPLRARLAALGRARSGQWTWERTATATCAAYDRALAAAANK